VHLIFCLAEDLTGDTDLMDSKVVGLSSILPNERYDQMVLLPIVEKDTIEVGLNKIRRWIFTNST
jgi:hypothetical protein